MTINCLIALAMQLKKEDIEGKRILEVGSQDVNGSISPLIKLYRPKEYLGVDLVAGKGVDVICDSKDLIAKFGKASFDMVISASVLEHVKDWKAAIHNIKGVCKNGGAVLITSCSYGFPYHAYPYDFWRYELGDFKNIFSDCSIQALEAIQGRLVLIKALKPEQFREIDLTQYLLYSIVTNSKVNQLQAQDFKTLYFRKIALRAKIMKFLFDGVNYIGTKI